VCIGMGATVGRLDINQVGLVDRHSCGPWAVRHHKARLLVDAVEPSGVPA
jgi:hypothetical protein